MSAPQPSTLQWTVCWIRGHRILESLYQGLREVAIVGKRNHAPVPLKLKYHVYICPDCGEDFVTGSA